MAALALSATSAEAQRSQGPDRSGPPRSGPPRPGGPGRGPDFNVQQTDRVVRTLAIGGNGLLELRNMAGDITVTAAPGREARIEIVRVARGRTEADAKLGLERTRITVDHQGERAVVAVEPPGERRPPYFVTVAYTVTAPPGTRLSVSSLSGNVTIADVKGEISAMVTRGNVDIRRASQVTAARTVSGDVNITDLQSDRGVVVNALSGTVHLERVRARRIEVDVTSGNVVLRAVTTDTVRLASLSGSVEYTGGLAAGGRYEFQVYSGNVQLNLTGPVGMELQVNTFRGNLRLDPALQPKAPHQARGSLRATIGDGGATVVVNSFSGDVEILRKN
jgi:DUF4097 and DUF4098 domain-containing protein YvlB